jgi:hypothetical protein
LVTDPIGALQGFLADRALAHDSDSGARQGRFEGRLFPAKEKTMRFLSTWLGPEVPRAAACAVLLAAVAAVPRATAQVPGADCSDLVVNRSFSQQLSGGFMNVPVFMNAPMPVGLVPTAGAGIITFLPLGRVSGKVTLAVGMLALAKDLAFDDTSRYTLAWDNRMPPSCVGTVTLLAPGEKFHFELRAVPGVQQIQMIHMDTGLVVSLVGYPMETAACSNDTIRGRYSYEGKGWALSPQTPPLQFPDNQMVAGYYPFAMSGMMTFESHTIRPPVTGAGVVTWWDTASANGMIMPRSGTGWYKVNPDCTGTIFLSEPTLGQAFTLEMFLGKDGGAVYQVNVDTVAIPGLGTIPAVVLGLVSNRVTGL